MHVLADDQHACASDAARVVQHGENDSGAGGRAESDSGCLAHVCRQFANMVVLREPYRRVLSHVMYIVEMSRRQWAHLVRAC